MKKEFFILYFLFTCTCLFAQDTIPLAPVSVERDPAHKLSGFSFYSFDSTLLSSSQHKTLSDFLNNAPSVTIKNYGPGSIATPTIRGGLTSHTAVLWNGFDINSSASGLTDLSIVPVGSSSRISVLFGGASLAYTSGALSGAILLENIPDWNRNLLVNARYSTGSFGYHSGLGNISWGRKNFFSKTSVVFSSAENDFPFNNVALPGSPRVKQKNARMMNTSFIQEFYARKKDHQFSLRYWKQFSDRNFAPSMITGDNMESQVDGADRVTAGWHLVRKDFIYAVDGYFSGESILYKNEIAAIDSRSHVQKFRISPSVRYIIRNFKTSLSVTAGSDRAESEGFKTKTRDILSFVMTTEFKKERFGTSLILRQEMIDNKWMTLLPSAGLRYLLAEKYDLFIFTSISRNLRVPTFNDLYWQPGGNPGLLTELSNNAEAGFSFGKRIGFTVNAFYNDISRLIFWIPGRYGYWSPSNISRAEILGVENRVKTALKRGSFMGVISGGYTYTKAINNTGKEFDGNQLIYVPLHRVNFNAHASWKRIYMEAEWQFFGKRFISEDNNWYLPSYFLTDFTAGALFLKKKSLNVAFRIRNILDVAYQNVAWRAMPGRNFEININYIFTK